MEIDQVLNAIKTGLFDNHLSDISQEVETRKARTREFMEWVEGDRVRINSRCRPKYLQGAEATVTKVAKSRVVIQLDKAHGRFPAAQDIKVPMELVDKI